MTNGQDDSIYDDDKVQHKYLGRTEFMVDKVLQNMLALGEYVTHRQIVHRSSDEERTATKEDGTMASAAAIDEELYSSHSQYGAAKSGINKE